MAHDEVYRPPAKNLLFGQFLVENNIITRDVLYKALQTQAKEKGDLKTSHRLLGTILFEDFGAIASRVELSRLLGRFNEYKEWVGSEHSDLRKFYKKHE